MNLTKRSRGKIYTGVMFKEGLVKGFKCGYCDEWHDELPLDIAMKWPEMYFSVPENERELKVWGSRYFTKIEDSRFAIRGLLFVPVKDYEEDFCWGLWAEVDKSTYEKIWDSWESDCSGETVFGVLDVNIPTYEDASRAEVEIRLSGPEEQPIFILKDKSTKLGIEQAGGIAVNRVLSINHEVLGN